MITIDFALQQLRSGAATLTELVRDVPEDLLSFRPTTEKPAWSIHEILCHMLYEERGDFRVRLDYTLHKPGVEWPLFDPEGVVTDNWHRLDARETLGAFLEERQYSLQWLEGLNSPDLDQAYSHPRLGEISAGTLLASWLGHDRLHIRQICQRNWEYLQERAAPHLLRYAGDW